ncbi:hypothetical protein DID75_04200, partial [Candidatus Marinamargulisbacteria bacterium SCGC AG-410-N11]
MLFFISISLSFLFIGFIYIQINWNDVFVIFSTINYYRISLAVALTLPIYLLNIFRLKILIPGSYNIGLSSCTKLLLLANLLNSFLPAKAGDLFKAVFFYKTYQIPKQTSLSIVI